MIRQAKDGAEAVQMRWGFVPYWFKGPTLKEFKLTTFNAKAESVATAASYKGPRSPALPGRRGRLVRVNRAE